MSEDHKRRGLALAGEGRPAEALMAFDAALAAEPGALDLLLYRGQVLVQLGRTAEGFAAITGAALRFHTGAARARSLPHQQRHDAEQAAWLKRQGIAVGAGLHLEGGGRV